MFKTKKPLMWERSKNNERFEFVDKNKIIHVVADENINAKWITEEW